MQVLLVYTTKTGVTRDIAHMISRKLKTPLCLKCEKDTRAEDLEVFDHVIIGAPLYMGHVRKLMRNFVYKHRDLLKKKHLYMFVVGADHDLDVEKYLRMSFPASVMDHVSVMSHVGGEFRFENASPLGRYIMKTVSEEKMRKDKREVKIKEESIDAFVQGIEHHFKKETDSQD